MTSTPRSRLALAVLALAALGFAACGGDDDGGGFLEPGQQDSDDGDDGDSEAGDTTPDDGDSEAGDTTPDDDGGDDDGDDGEGDGGDGGDELGFCHVKVTGDIESEWTSNGGTMAVGYGPWLPESMQDPAYPADETYFIINCIGEGSDYIGFLATGDGPGVPMEATSYNLPVGTGGLSAGTQDAVEVIIGLNGPDTVWDTDTGAVLVITEFDEDHIAGTFTVPVVDGLADMTGVDNGTATLTGEFEFANPYG